MADAPVASVLLTAEEEGLSLVCPLSDVPQITGGVGGWEAVARPGRRPLLAWRGRSDALTLSLPILFDGWDEGHSVEADLLTLEQLGGGGNGSKDAEPPLLTVEGWPPFQDQRAGGSAQWVLNALEYGDALTRSSDLHRVRAAVTATLLLHTEDEQLAAVRKRSAHPAYRYVHVRPGDTFEKIAARELKKKSLGGKLARLNGARSPDVKLKRSTVKVPTGHPPKWPKED